MMICKGVETSASILNRINWNFSRSRNVSKKQPGTALPELWLLLWPSMSHLASCEHFTGWLWSSVTFKISYSFPLQLDEVLLTRVIKGRETGEEKGKEFFRRRKKKSRWNTCQKEEQVKILQWSVRMQGVCLNPVARRDILASPNF